MNPKGTSVNLEHGRTPLKHVSNVYHCSADNIGDLMCGPAQYLWPQVSIDLPLAPVPTFLENVAVGGGQLFSQLSMILASIYEANPAAKVVAWGVGVPPVGTNDMLVREVAQEFALFGTRNYDRREHLTFVPCASCLSPLFDQVESPKHEFVFFLHKRKGGQIDMPHDAPMMTNTQRPPREVIDFIASGETVVTSSYHGVYWAQLLGRRVVCLPYNNKFKTFQHMPTMAEPTNWRAPLASVSHVSPLLEEYRALNYIFAEKALDVWNG